MNVSITLSGITVHLKEDHNFHWLFRVGRVFCVFDQQDSGNICFGVEAQDGKQFIKYAGAKPTEFEGDPRDAVQRLKEAVDVYEDLVHEHLIALRSHFAVDGGGYALVYEWFNGECLHPHWSYPPPAKYTDSRSPYYRFRQLSIKLRLEALDHIYSFHKYTEAKRYVAIDFYDGSILYNFDTHTTKICDIDFYQRQPCTNTNGWGSPRYIAPEELDPTTQLDERTNVFRMGAIAFGLLGGELDRSRSKWEGGEELYRIALKAVDDNPMQRYASVREFTNEWNQYTT
ncbi:unnamed protein product [Didymodactylos carnosus]|uniref:Protein kinase domain-containing protein n=1 Tax=Didymodactylos carnosus TaxID=1234261 RepID=A0A814A7T3_9BILA|nr:unnamed protein product [Didymodactylos carnosus]CAF0909731.1 unnamed protein product [Didymodactylos carnosus]CAF3504515.1 unnamed protein product [Didymodactylos carnosus]CAF3691055.1 unnamed protein product [Didymodactylos carnosus]